MHESRCTSSMRCSVLAVHRTRWFDALLVRVVVFAVSSGEQSVKQLRTTMPGVGCIHNTHIPLCASVCVASRFFPWREEKGTHPPRRFRSDVACFHIDRTSLRRSCAFHTPCRHVACFGMWRAARAPGIGKFAHRHKKIQAGRLPHFTSPSWQRNDGRAMSFLYCAVGGNVAHSRHAPPSTTRPSRAPVGQGPRVLVGWPLPLGFGLGGCLLLARRGRVCV